MQPQRVAYADIFPSNGFNPLLQGDAEVLSKLIVSQLPTVDSPVPFELPAALKERLANAGYGTDRQGDAGLMYVLMLVHDPVRDLVIGLLKKRGPAFLVDKLTFPGGKTEPGETPEEACSRETKEEAGISVPLDAWKFVARSGVVMVMAAVSDQVIHARQCDDEPVFVMSVPRQLEYAARTPESYVPDFIVLLEAGLATLG